MAALSRAVVCQERDNRMTDKTNNSLTPVATHSLDVCQSTSLLDLRRSA